MKLKDDFLAKRLALSSIPANAATYAGIRSMDACAARAAGFKLPAYCSDGFLIPYYDAKGGKISFWRWRNDPGARQGFQKLTEQGKYAQGLATDCVLYLPRVKGLSWEEIFEDPPTPAVIVEGELKALALCLRGVMAVGIGGVWNFAKRRVLLPELALLAKHGRELLILFDSDAADKPQVCGARFALARALVEAGGKPVICEMPRLLLPEKTGADDYLRLHPDLRDEALFDALKAMKSLEDREHALFTEIYRLNAQYVLNEHAARVVRLFMPDGSQVDGHHTDVWKRGDFCGLIENQEVLIVNRAGKDTLQRVSDRWLKWKQLNRVQGYIYQPVAQEIQDFLYIHDGSRRYLNDFEGWASAPVENQEIVKKYWTALLDALFIKQSDESEEQTALRKKARWWFEQWCSFPVQRPGARMKSAAVLSGTQGGGKDMVGRALRLAVYGKHYRLITPAELESNFNSSFMANVSFIHAQELTSKSNKRHFKELLKAFITSESLRVEAKYVDAYYTTPKFNFYMTTNPEDSIDLDWDDRRYFIWRIAPARIQELLNTQWVDEFHEVIQSPEGRSALHYHLLHFPLDGFDPNAEPPITEAKLFAQKFSANEAEAAVEKFAERCREEQKDKVKLQGVWLAEHVRHCLLGQVFPVKMFLAAFRKYFYLLGRSGRDFETAQKIKINRPRLWVLRATAADIRESKFPKMQEAEERFEVLIQDPKNLPVQPKYT